MATIRLLVVARDPDESDPARTRFGGAPSVGDGFRWPVCRACGGAMQSLGQIRLEGPERLLSLFMCQNRPGLCSEWEADRGANAVIRLDTHGLQAAEPPATGAAIRPTRHGASIFEVEAESYDAARAAYGAQPGRRQRDVLGQVGGEPLWLDADETPRCDHCGRPMRFAALIEEGPDRETEMNFAGRCAQIFECDCAGGVGKLCW